MSGIKKIKILHVLRTTELGGAEVNLLNLLKNFDFNRFEMHVGYCCSGGGLEERLRQTNAKLFKYSDHAYKIKSFGTFIVIGRIAQYIKKEKIDIVHTHTSNAHIWGGMAAKIACSKIVEHVHDFRYSIPVDYAKRLGTPNKQFKYFRKVKNFSNVVVVLTQEYYSFLVENKLYPEKKILKLPNGVSVPLNPAIQNNETKNKILHKLDLPQNKKLVLTSCRISREKNIDLILKFAKRVHEQHPDVIFAIAGTGPLLEDLKNKCKAFGIDSFVKFLGFQSNILEILEVSDIYLLPSLLELHSIAIIEAMSKGIPVVVSKGVGSNNEFINDWQNGVLLDPFEDKGWAEAIIRLLKDEQLRQKIGRNGYQTCFEKFNLKNVVKSFENLYVELTRS